MPNEREIKLKRKRTSSIGCKQRKVELEKEWYTGKHTKQGILIWYREKFGKSKDCFYKDFKKIEKEFDEVCAQKSKVEHEHKREEILYLASKLFNKCSELGKDKIALDTLKFYAALTGILKSENVSGVDFPDFILRVKGQVEANDSNEDS